jgi:hypothetical protein
MKRWMSAVLLATVSTLGGHAMAADTLPEFTATYDATWNGMRLGEIEISLSRQTEFCYVYRSDTRPVRLVRMFYGSPSEISRFCLVDGQVRPVHFEFDAGKESYKLDFDWIKKEVRGGDEVRELPEDAQDRFGMQQAVRLWLTQHAPQAPDDQFRFTMVEDDRMREYVLEVTGQQDVKVPHGEYSALLLQRADTDRLNRFWVAPGADYMPVKVESGRDGKVQLTMELKRFERKESSFD